MASRIFVQLIALLGVLFLLLSSAAIGQGYHGQGHDELHDWYLTLRDWKGRPCCNGQDGVEAYLILRLK